MCSFTHSMRCVFYHAERGGDGCVEGVGSAEGAVDAIEGNMRRARALARATAFEQMNTHPRTQSAENARTCGYTTNIEHNTTSRALRTASS